MVPLSISGMADARIAAHGYDAAAVSRAMPANVSTASRAESARLGRWLAVGVVAVVLISLAHVWVRLKVVDVGYRISYSRRIIGALREERAVLQARLESLRSPQRLSGDATARLGMVRPEKGQVVVLP